MNQALQIGPLALPMGVLLFFAAAALGLLAAALAARRSGVSAENTLYRALLVGLLTARLGFVFQFRAAYFAEPWSILDLRDGGWDAQLGLAGVWVYALAQWRRSPALRRPLLAALVSGSLAWVAGTVWMVASGPGPQPLPAFTAQSLSGEAVDMQQFAGRPLVVNLWATWCPPCRREMPVLEQAQQLHADVHIVFLNQGESAATVQRFLAAQGLSLQHVLLDPRRELARDFQQTALPTTLFFGADGRLAGLRVGELSRATLEQQLRALR